MQRSIFPAVLIGGPPHSGKSVLGYSLTRALRKRKVDHYLLRACPDGEGDWSNEASPETVQRIRQKGSFSALFVDRVCEDLSNRHLPLLVDVGGRPTDAQKEIFSHCTHAILISSSAQELLEWRLLAEQFELTIIALLDSVLTGQDDLQASQPLIRAQIAGLERGHTATGPVVDAVVDVLTQLFTENAAQYRQHHLATAPPAAQLTLLDALHATWAPEHLPHALSRQSAGATCALYGRSANWVYAAYALHNAPHEFWQFDPRLGWVAALPLEITTTGLKERLLWRIEHDPAQAYDLYEFACPHSYVDYGEMRGAALPLPPPAGRGLVISGKLPLWLWTAIARAYRACAWIGIYYPRMDAAVIVQSDSPNYALGSMVAVDSRS